MSETMIRPLPTARTCGQCRYCLAVAGANPPRVCTLHGVGVADQLPACKQYKEWAGV